MTIRVSTKVEEAWYVDPELLAGDAENPQPRKVEISSEGPLPRDMTVTLGEKDLEECPDGLQSDDEEARHYRQVSLRGAMLVNDGPLAPGPSWSEKLLGKVSKILPGGQGQAQDRCVFLPGRRPCPAPCVPVRRPPAKRLL